MRTVVHGDGVAWLEAATLGETDAIVTSLPDHSEIPTLGFDGWRRWFTDTAALCCARAPLAIFYQTDVKHEGAWIDKGHLVHTGADRTESRLLWHKIACRVPPGTTTFGRPAYAHVLCFGRGLSLSPGQASADVFPELGEMTWARAMGVAVCHAVARFLLAHTAARRVIDPFCGVGTMLAVANAHGLEAVGVELSRRRAARAKSLTIA